MEIQDTLRRWIALDDEARSLQTHLKTIRQEKQKLSGTVLEFMKGHNLDNFQLEGGSGGTLSRQVRNVRPALRRDVVRTQLLLQFADQPERAAAVLRAIEGVAEGDDMSVSGVQKELLSRRVPKTSQTISLS